MQQRREVPSGELADGVGETGFRVEAIQLGGLDQGVEERGALPAQVGPDELEILSAMQSFA